LWENIFVVYNEHKMSRKRTIEMMMMLGCGYSGKKREQLQIQNKENFSYINLLFVGIIHELRNVFFVHAGHS
jgi:hypothetical protein